MKIKSTKYNINDSVYVNTKEGMSLQKIESMSIYIQENKVQNNMYWIRIPGQGSECYNEAQIWESMPAAKNHLKENINQLQLALPA